jgi:hypothetical protein
VRGLEALPAGDAAFVLRSDYLAQAGDSVRRLYQASQAAYVRQTALGLGMIAGVFATTAYYTKGIDGNWKPGWGIGLPLATLVLGYAGMGSAAGAEDRLQRAIWLHNRGLAITADSSPPACAYERCALRVRPGVWGDRVVRGAGDTPIGRTANSVAVLETAGDSTRFYYESFRTGRRQTATARRVGLLAYLVAGTLLIATDGDVGRGFALGFGIVGYGAAHLSQYGSARAAGDLNKAIWFYNRDNTVGR